MKNNNLFHSRFSHLARNTIDYWMTPDELHLTETDVLTAIRHAPILEDANLQYYIHVPFCAQKCSFCAFSGGNSLDFKQAERYANLLVDQLHYTNSLLPIHRKPIESIHIGGGSPDLLGKHIGLILEAVRALPGCTDSTEISVEMALSTVKDDFLDELIKYQVTKASFGLQSLFPDTRRYLRMPVSLRKFEEVSKKLKGNIPIINADLITCLPGQTLKMVDKDLHDLMEHSAVNAISTYLLTPGAAPSLVADLKLNKVPALPPHNEQAYMRLHSYSTLQKNGWVRKGTNTYMDANTIEPEILDIVSGNECIGASHYEAFLVGVGAQAISSLPGLRLENTVDVNHWSKQVEQGELPCFLPKCSLKHQKDTALWTMPLFYFGLPQHRFDRMMANNALDDSQLNILNQYIDEGLIIKTAKGFELSILGEVFMGHLVSGLKKEEDRKVIAAYIDEGYSLGNAIAKGTITRDNSANNRQIAEVFLQR